MKHDRIQQLIDSVLTDDAVWSQARLNHSNAGVEANAVRWAQPGAAEAQSAKMKEALADPLARAAISAQVKASWSDKEAAKKKSEGMKRAYRDPDIIKRKSEALKKAHQNPEVKKRLTDALNAPDVKAKQRAASKARWDAARDVDPVMAERHRQKVEAAERIAAGGRLTPERLPCTVDGVNIYRRKRDMASILGSGKDGTRSPNFRYLTKEEAAAYTGVLLTTENTQATRAKRAPPSKEGAEEKLRLKAEAVARLAEREASPKKPKKQPKEPTVNILVSPEGIIHEVQHLPTFIIEHGLSGSGVSCVLTGKFDVYRGWTGHRFTLTELAAWKAAGRPLNFKL